MHFIKMKQGYSWFACLPFTVVGVGGTVVVVGNVVVVDGAKQKL